MIRKLRIKFVAINMSIVTIMLIAMFFLFFHTTKQNLEQESINMLQNMSGNPEFFMRPGRPAENTGVPVFILSRDSFGNIYAEGSGYYDLSDKNTLFELMQIANRSTESYGKIPEYHLRFVKIRTPMEECIIFADTSTEDQMMETMFRNCILIGVGSFVGFFIISIFLARWAVKPVENAWNQQKQFVADASHELKTPLTVITTNVELLQSNANIDFNDKMHINNILHMTRQMRGLVESLLELARIDNDSLKFEMTKIDLSNVINDAILPFEAVFFEKNLELSSLIEAQIFTKGNAAQIRQLLEVFLDNALHYSTDGGKVEVVLQKVSGKYCLLSVSNQGIPISKEDIKNIFKRFYRGDKARTMCHNYGLGLAIAQNIVEKHKGKIWADSINGRNTFWVKLPIL